MSSDYARKQGLLRRYQIIRTDDPEKMRQALIKAHGTAKFEVERNSTNFFAQASHVQLMRIGFDFCAYGANVAIEFPQVNSFRQQICLTSAGETMLGRRTVPLSIGQTCVIPPGAKIATRYAANFHQLVLRIDADALHWKLESLIGTPLCRRLELDSEASFQMPALRTLRRTVFFLVNELDSSNSQFSDLLLTELEQTIMVSFLCGHHHNFSNVLDKPPRDAAPRQVRLTEAYIEANWNRPITVEAISEAVGISARSIFKSFKEARGHSPMTFVKERRLRHAREMLCIPSSTTSVTGVAFDCGFCNLGHFAREYKLRFGELPSETLAQARA